MSVRILIGDVRAKLAEMPDASVHCVVTSPPYFGLRDYGMPGQIGLEPTPAEFVTTMVEVFRDVRRVLRDDGALWLNLGDSYAGGSTNGVPRVGIVPGEGGKLQGRNRNGVGAVDSLKAKDLIGIPWRVAFALQADGWYLRQDIIWAKPNPMPESVTDRCTKAHEYMFLLAKSGAPTIWRARDTREWSSAPDHSEVVPWPTDDNPDETRARWRGFDYYYDAEAIAEPGSPNTHATGKDGYRGPVENGKILNGDRADKGKTIGGGVESRNRRSVWTVATQPFKEAHFATFPPALIEPCILAGCPKGGTVLDPFGGAGTTGLVADRLGRNALLIELNPEYARIAEKRIRDDSTMFADVLSA